MKRKLALLALALPLSLTAAEKMNVLFIAVDDMRPEMGCYGNSEVRTPNLDRLAQTGLRFLNHLACAPAPEPGRATLLTGRTPMQLGGADADSPGETPLSKVLADAGYACAAAGLGADSATA